MPTTPRIRMSTAKQSLSKLSRFYKLPITINFVRHLFVKLVFGSVVDPNIKSGADSENCDAEPDPESVAHF